MKGFEEMFNMLPMLLISSIGGLANYIYKTSKGEEFHWGRLIANIFLAGWIGYVVQGFIPPETIMHGPILAITGFSAYPILQFLEKFGGDLITKYIKTGQ